MPVLHAKHGVVRQTLLASGFVKPWQFSSGMLMLRVAEMRATHVTRRVCCPGPHEALHEDQSLDCHLAEKTVIVKT